MTSTITPDVSDDHVDTDDAAGDSIEGVERAPGGLLRGLQAVDLWILGALFLWPCAYLPMLAYESWTPRVMALVVALPTGALAIWSLLRRRDRAAVFAAAAVCWMLIGAALSGNVILSLKGVIARNSSVLIFAGALGLWATARFMSARGRALVAPVFVAACAVNVLVGVAQVVFRLDSSSMSLQGDRAVGLIGSSILFGAVMAAGGAMSIRLGASREHSIDARLWLIAAFVLSLGAAISGSRVAMVAVVVAGLAGVITVPRGRAAMSMGVALAGVLAGSVMTRIAGGERDSLSRLSESGTGGRTTVWRRAGDAVLERPLTGWGLGRFRYALQGRYSVDELVEMPHLPDFWDAHNVVVELAVVVGIPGLILFGGFAWCAARRSAPAMVVAAGAIVVTWLLQPISYSTLPIAMMLLGAGTLTAAGTRTESSLGGHRRSVVGAALAVGVVPAVFLGVADIRLEQAVEASDIRGMESAAAMFVHDPMVADVVVNAGWAEAATDLEWRRVMFDAIERTLEIEPENPYWWTKLATAQGAILDDPEAARRSADRALDLSAFDEQAWNTVWVASIELGDDERRLEAAEILCRFEFEPACDDLDAERS